MSARKRSVQDYEVCAFLDITADDLVKVRDLYPETYRKLVRSMLWLYSDSDRLAACVDDFFRCLSGPNDPDRYDDRDFGEMGGGEW